MIRFLTSVAIVWAAAIAVVAGVCTVHLALDWADERWPNAYPTARAFVVLIVGRRRGP